MTTREEIEVRLVRAVSVDPSEDGLRWLDQRVARRMAQGAPAAAGTRGRGARSLRFLLRPLALVAAFVLLTGAVIGGVSLLERLSESTPGWRVAYDDAELIGIAQTDAGYTITLERAYADLNQVVAFFTIERAGGLEAPRSSDGFLINHFSLNAVDVRDPAGTMAIARTATADLEPDLAAAAEAFQFEHPLAAGTYQLRMTTQQATPPAVGQTPQYEMWVEFVQGGQVRGREVLSIVPDSEIAQVADRTAPRNSARVELLKGEDYLRVWINRSGNHYLVHLPVAKK